MRNAPIARPTYFYDPDFEGRGSIMQRSLDGADPVTERQVRNICVRLRALGERLAKERPEAASFVSGMAIDAHNALTGLRAAERGQQSERRTA